MTTMKQPRDGKPMAEFVPFPEEALRGTLVRRFEEQVARRGDAVALRSLRHELSYRELNAAADRAARALAAGGAQGLQNVALALENGAPAIIGMLAALKAGMAYVPLDPDYPRARNEFILADTESAIVLTNDANLEIAREMAGARRRIINLDAAESGAPPARPGHQVGPDTRAYILYTSGTTGQPKGGPHTHANVLCEIMNYTNLCGLSGADRMLLVSSCSFSDAVRTIYGALLNGASLHPYDIRRDGLAGLAAFVDRERITVFRGVPTVHRNFFGALESGRTFPAIRLAFLAGEPVYRRDVELLRAHLPRECVIVNGLGSSETFTYCVNLIGFEDVITETHVPVGRPCPHRKVLLLDEAQRPVADGEIGEFAVGTPYMVRQFWRRPDLDREKFIADPDGEGVPLYLTGDLGRRFPDGSFVHLGRKDFQIKVRGHRVEAAEVEQALVRTGLVRQAAVAGRPDKTGETRLVAYVVAGEGERPSATQLRRGICESLPDYMLPGTFVFLDSLPRLANGKLNLRALPAPGRERPPLDVEYAAPRTPVEHILAEIWSETLEIDGIGINDNFLDLGGHSLLAARIAARVHDRFQMEVSPTDLLRAPTVAQMAVWVAAALSATE